MARDLDLEPSFLSAVMRGKKNLSSETARRVALSLELDENAVEAFCLMAQIEQTKSDAVRLSLTERLSELLPHAPVYQIHLDHFRIVSDWYHTAIIELTSLRGFDFDERNIAKRLGIGAMEARLAIERLVRAKLIRQNNDGSYRRTYEMGQVQSQEKNSALREYHRQLLGKAIESLTSQTPQERFTGSEVLNINPKQIPKAQKMIDEFMKKLVPVLQEGRRTETYCLAIKLFDLKRRK